MHAGTSPHARIWLAPERDVVMEPPDDFVIESLVRRHGMADATAPARAQRAPALLSIIGSALMVVSYFLPDYLGITNPPPNNSPVMQTLWDALLRVGNFTHNQVPITNQPHVFVAVMFGIPLVMGVVIAALGVLGLLRDSGDLHRGFGVAAVIFALVSSLIPLFFGTFAFTGFGGQPMANDSLVGLGAVMLLLGLFFVTAAAFGQPRRAA
jgi:hypothetical protein